MYNCLLNSTRPGFLHMRTSTIHDHQIATFVVKYISACRTTCFIRTCKRVFQRASPDRDLKAPTLVTEFSLTQHGLYIMKLKGSLSACITPKTQKQNPSPTTSLPSCSHYPSGVKSHVGCYLEVSACTCLAACYLR